MNCYLKIFLDCNKNLEIEQIQSPVFLFSKIGNKEDFNFIKHQLTVDKNCLYIFDELAYSHLLSVYCIDETHKNIISEFLKNAKYMVFFCEIFENNTLKTFGNELFNLEFALLFFSKSIKNMLCNTNNILFLNEYNIKENIFYFPPLGFSKINNLIPLKINSNKNTDILFMGSVGRGIYHYRNKQLDVIKEFSISNQYNFECYDMNLFDEEKNKKICDTKIVIHVPSYSNLDTFPWAKTAELMCKKIFFIIEFNKEILQNNMNNIVAYYYPDIPNDLTSKIKYYLEHEEERQKHIELSYNFIKNTYDMDKFIQNIF